MWLMTTLAITFSALMGSADQDPRVEILVTAVRTAIDGIEYSGMAERGLVVDTRHIVVGDGPTNRGGQVAAAIIRELGARSGALESFCVPTRFGEGRPPLRGARAVIRAGILELEAERAVVHVSVVLGGDSGFGFARTYELKHAADGWQVNQTLSAASGGCPQLPPR